jgi:hypothetical protein
MTAPRKLKMKFAGRFIDLLGHQMYGGAVPSVAEFVANAWDADAEKVEISLPSDPTHKDAEIVVKDYGEGMTFDELNDYYLNIGYERRKVRGDRTAKGRLVMGRKGIGKLAGFGIANDIKLRSVKNGHAIEFNLNYTELKAKTELAGFEFTPDYDGPAEGDEKNGVTIVLKNLNLKNAIDPDTFKKSMARRFALGTDEMEIQVNGQKVLKEELEFEHQDIGPQGEWIEEDVPGFGKVSYWFGFLKDTIKDKELRGVTIFARKRVAQFTPFHFNLSGGITGQVGLEYLTGQVRAEGLDEDIDYVSTSRQSVNWQFGNAPVLEEWGRQKIRQLCKDWKKRREEKNLEAYRHNYSDLAPVIEGLPQQEKDDLGDALEKIAGMEKIGEDEFKVIARSMVAGAKRESVKKVIQRINATSEEALPELYEAMKEWDIIGAVATAEVVMGKIGIIKQFGRHIEERLPEKAPGDKPDMQKFVRDYPWLLGHDFEHLEPADLQHEHGVDAWIVEVIKETDKEYADKDKREGRRFDLLCMKHKLQCVVLELMRPGEPADYDHLMRLERYVSRLQSAFDKQRSDQPHGGGIIVNGMLIADDFAEDSSLMKTLQKLAPSGIHAVEWRALFRQAQAGYKDYFDILKLKAPEDPRMKGLVDIEIDSESEE